MKRLTLVMVMALLVSACNETTTGVKPTRNPGGGDGYIPPDTVIKHNGIATEFFGPDHPVAVEREATLVAREDISTNLTTLEEQGYSYTPGSTMVCNFRFPDGRVAELTIFHLPGSGGFTHVIHLRIGERELTRSIRVRDRGDGRLDLDPLAETEKIGGAPQSVWTLGWIVCIMQAYSETMACIHSCGVTNSWPCIRSCLRMALASFGNCLEFAIE